MALNLIVITCPGWHLDRGAAEEFLKLKIETVGYGEASIRTPEDGKVRLTRAPDGAVETYDDAMTFIAALEEAHPRRDFGVEMQTFEDATDVTWHTPHAFA